MRSTFAPSDWTGSQIPDLSPLIGSEAPHRAIREEGEKDNLVREVVRSQEGKSANHQRDRDKCQQCNRQSEARRDAQPLAVPRAVDLCVMGANTGITW